MKKFTNKNFIQKIVITILIVLSFNFVVPTFSQADVGGVLFGPVIDLIAGLGDAIMSGLEFFMDGSRTGGSFVNFITTEFMVKPDEYTSVTGQADKVISSNDLDHGWFGLGTYRIPVSEYSPEQIFSNKVPALDANFINPIEYTGIQAEKSIAIQLRDTISNWYKALRNLVIVGLLSVLLYVGIRMMISSTASDKAKYKQMLLDWLVALCLLFFLHYIMSFTMTLTQTITDGISEGATEIIVEIPEDGIKFKTNITGFCRFQVQYADFLARMVYLIFYIALVVYTVMFTWKYMKRAITMAFLTIMAPIVTLTYPIDKISDGKAQAFNAWIREYIFNALLQPFHLIIYTVFLGASTDIAVENPIYAILFLAFITPAEKLLRKFFGFDKASSAGGSSFAGGFGGAAAFRLVSSALGKIGKGNGNGGHQGGGNNNNVRTQRPIESNDTPQGYQAFANSNNSNNTNGQSNRTRQERMLDAYDENYGTNEWDPQEREAMARELYAGNNEGTQYTDEEYANILRDAGWSEEDIAREMGTANNDLEQSQQIRQQSAVTESQTDETTPELSRGRRTINGFAALGRRAFTGANLRRAGRFVGRTAIRTVTAGAIGAVGLGMGIAGDDLEDVITYGIAGTSLGATAGANTVMRAGSAVGRAASSVAGTFREGYYGVNAEQVRRQTRQFMQNEEAREYLATEFATEDDQKLSGRELNQVMEQASYYNNSGVNDLSKIKKSIKLENSIRSELENNSDLTEEDRTTMAKEQAVTIAKIADQVDEKKLMTDQKYADGLQKNFERGLKKANPSLGDTELANQSQQMMKLLKKYKKID